MKTILVPTDLSPAAQNATDYAAHLCKELGAKMILLKVYMLPVPVSEIPFVMVSADELQQASESALTTEAQRVSSLFGINTEWFVRMGATSEEIITFLDEINIDLLVMGMTGAEGLDKMMGSTASAVIRKCNQAVIVVPAEASFSAFRLLSYATDFTYPAHDSCFDPLKFLVSHYKAELIVVTIQKPGEAQSEELPGKQKFDMLFTDTKRSYQTVENNDVEHGLQNFIKEHRPDLLAMVAHKHSFIERLFGAQLTKSMIFQTHIPMLILEDKS